VAGTYTDMIGTEMCLTCPAGTSSSMGSDELLACKCMAGYNAMSDGLACSACEPGSYKSDTGPGECVICPGAFFSSEPASTDLTDCKCAAGYTSASDGMTCVACESGKYKAGVGMEPCISCDSVTANGKTHSPLPGAKTCVNCPVNQESAGITCYCMPEFLINIEEGGCSFRFQSAATLNLYVNIANEDRASFSGRVSGGGKQAIFLDSVSKRIAIARKSITIDSITVLSGRRLLAGGINVVATWRASTESTESMIELLTKGDFEIDFPGSTTTDLHVSRDVTGITEVFSSRPTAQTTTTQGPSIEETPIPITNSSLSGETINLIIAISIFVGGCICICSFDRHSQSKQRAKHNQSSRLASERADLLDIEIPHKHIHTSHVSQSQVPMVVSMNVSRFLRPKMTGFEVVSV
jgi:hypothetical protein